MICDANIVLVVLAKQQADEPISIWNLHKACRMSIQLKDTRTWVTK